MSTSELLLKEKMPCGHDVTAYLEDGILHVYAECEKCRDAIYEGAKRMPQFKDLLVLKN